MLNRMLQPNSPIDESQILEFEARYDLNLPLAYRTFLLKHNGGQPDPAGFPIQGFPDNPDGVIQAFFGLNATISTESLETIMTELVGNIPKGVLPIGCTEGDDFVCIDLRKARKPVVFWDRKPFWGRNLWREKDLYFVADNFETFLDNLHDL